MVRQPSASIPCITPLLSGNENPATTPATPQASWPRARTASSVAEPLPWAYAAPTPALASVAAIAATAIGMVCRSIGSLPLCAGRHPA